jgi:putative cardiolipin synthase
MVAGIVMALLGGCGGLPDNHARTFSEAISDGESTSLGKAFRLDIENHPDQSGVFLLGNGRDAFVARA